MSFWTSFKNLYGLFMGTTTDYLKPSNRPLWPTKMHAIDDNFSVFLGGTGNCGVLRDGDRVLLINCNSGIAADKLFEKIEGTEKTLIVTSNFLDYAGGVVRSSFKKVFAPAHSPFYKAIPDVHLLDKDLEIQWGDESVYILPVENTFSKKDFVVYLKNRKVLFTGGLFYNGIHPILDSERGVDTKKWVKELQEIKQRFYPKTIVPHEGDLCGIEKLESFSSYLQALSNPDIEFSYCREHFDWPEIPGYTSLEENFDLLRSKH